jgi:hypothetical protein
VVAAAVVTYLKSQIWLSQQASLMTLSLEMAVVVALHNRVAEMVKILFLATPCMLMVVAVAEIINQWKIKVAVAVVAVVLPLDLLSLICKLVAQGSVALLAVVLVPLYTAAAAVVVDRKEQPVKVPDHPMPQALMAAMEQPRLLPDRQPIMVVVADQAVKLLRDKVVKAAVGKVAFLIQPLVKLVRQIQAAAAAVVAPSRVAVYLAGLAVRVS